MRVGRPLDPSQGGLFVWMTRARGARHRASTGRCSRGAWRRGSSTCPGEFAFAPEPGPVPANHLRLTFGVPAEAELVEGARRLAAALAACLDSGRLRGRRRRAAARGRIDGTSAMREAVDSMRSQTVDLGQGRVTGEAVVVKILQRYVLGEVLRAFLLALLTMTAIFVLFMVVAEAMRSKLLTPAATSSQLVPYVIPSTLPYTIPVSLLFAVTVVYGRIAGDNEVIAVKSAGLSVMTVSGRPSSWPPS